MNIGTRNGDMRLRFLKFVVRSQTLTAQSKAIQDPLWAKWPESTSPLIQTQYYFAWMHLSRYRFITERTLQLVQWAKHASYSLHWAFSAICSISHYASHQFYLRLQFGSFTHSSNPKMWYLIYFSFFAQISTQIIGESLLNPGRLLASNSSETQNGSSESYRKSELPVAHYILYQSANSRLNHKELY